MKKNIRWVVKDDIKEINFFFCSTSLVDAVSPVLAIFPIINIYHTGIGVQLIGKGLEQLAK